MNTNPDNATSAEAINESRGARLRRSCEACRNAKAKCGPSKEDPKKCYKCVKDNRQCLFLEAKPRLKRAKTSRTRVQEMEEKVETLLALLTSNRAGNTAPTPASDTSTSELPEPANFLINSSTLSAPHTESSKVVQFPVFQFPIYETFDDAISKGIISLGQAEECLRLFRLKCSNFPFVKISPRITVDILRRQRPFLLLSILAFGTESNALLQERLGIELKETLARKVIINGEKSLDLLQGILIYLAWYHFHFDPLTQQIYQLAQMASAIACDLGLNKNTVIPPANPLGHLNGPYRSMLSPDELESRRAFLGCYYLTSWQASSIRKPNSELIKHRVALGLRKPSSLRYTNYMEECARSLTDAREEDTDYLLIYFIRFQHLAEEVNQTFDYETAEELSHSDSIRIGILLRGFEQRLDEFQTSSPPEIWSNVALALSFYSLRIYVNEVCFHASPPHDGDLVAFKAESWYFSSARNESFIRCLQACKQYLDYALALTPAAYLDLTLPDFGRLVYAILVLGSFAGNCSAPMLDAAQVKQCADFDYYLNGFTEKTTEAITKYTTDGSNPYMSYVNALYAKIQIYYTFAANDRSGRTASVIGYPRLSFLDILTTIKENCVEIEASSATMSDASSGEQWVDILNEWSTAPLQSQLSMNEPQE